MDVLMLSGFSEAALTYMQTQGLCLWVTSQQDHGDSGGGAPFSKVRKYLRGCLLNTHRFAF